MNASRLAAIGFALVLLAGLGGAVAEETAAQKICNITPQCDNCPAPGDWPLPVDWKPSSDDCWCYPPCPAGLLPDMPPGICFPHPQARPAFSTQVTTRKNGHLHTEIVSGHSIWPTCNPFDHETYPGNNLLPSIFTNMFDRVGNEMVNTLPSTPYIPYNLHDGDPVVTVINPTSPADDLKEILDDLIRQSGTIIEITRKLMRPKADEEKDFFLGEVNFLRTEIPRRIQMGIDILEGNPIENRAYTGMAALHYNAGNRVGVVEPIYDDTGETIIGGNVDVHQIWFGGRIEADTAFLDVSKIIAPCTQEDKDANGGNCPETDPGVPWTITYKVDVLNRGDDDFSPFVTYWDDDFRSKISKPHIGMDQSFFNMDAGTRTEFKILMAPGKYLNLVYTWGWRMHPPRIQVMENANKAVTFADPEAPSPDNLGLNVGCDLEKYKQDPALTLVGMEQTVFGDRDDFPDGPKGYDEYKQGAIPMIGDMAPAKRIYNALLEARGYSDIQQYEELIEVIQRKAQPAYFAWLDRLHLPCYDVEPSEDGICKDGFNPDPDADVTILYANNTLYGDFTGGRPTTRGVWTRWDEWEERPETLKVKVLNADDFVHAYTIADFGGSRGWENQFKSSVRVAGSGCWFTFGRANWWMPAGAPKPGKYLCIPKADGDTPGLQTFDATLQFEPSRRLRFYQFDPWHHELAIWSVH